ncbi:triose-phosphate isomerase [bacterium]|nr:triose-phosphate isomerase [bacterium]
MAGKPLVTAEDVLRTPPGRAVFLPEGAILTPLARDLLRKRGQPLPAGATVGPRPVASLVVANWKSNKKTAEALAFAEAFARAAPRSRARAVICPPFTALALVKAALGDAADLGAQDVSPFEEGAHTGEVAASQLADLGCLYAIVGHSERRAEQGEDDSLVRRKVSAALAAKIRPILCVGETREERDAGRTSHVVRSQIRAALEGLEGAAEIVLAYEPRWAIGRGVVPRDDEIVAACLDAREELSRSLGERGTRTPVLYGGSVAVENARSILSLEGVSGLLVGGASLNVESFLRLVAAAG